MRWHSKAVCIMLLITLVSISTSTSYSTLSESSIIVVPHDFPTIQEAVNAANSGDTIYVESGVYYEWVSITKSLVLIGENPNTTIIQSPTSTGTGVQIYTNDTSISGFTIKNYPNGMQIWGNNHTVDSNIFQNDCNLILNSYSKNNTIRNNLIPSGEYGIKIMDSSNYNLLTGNFVSNNDWGINMRSCRGNTLRNNSMVNNNNNFRVTGTNINHYIHDVDSSNTVDGKPIYYWLDQHNKTIPSNGGCIVLVNSTNILVRGLNLSNNAEAIQLQNTNQSIIENSQLSHNGKSMVVTSSNFNIIRDNTIIDDDDGINVYNSHNNTITNNTIATGEPGVRLSSTTNCSVIKNIFINCSIGMNIISSTDLLISDNNITNSGIHLQSSSRSIIKNNIVTSFSPRNFGIRIEQSPQNVILNNTLIGNQTNFGVFGNSLSHFILNITIDNTVNGRPIFYWVNQQDQQVPLSAGYVGIINSTNIIVKDLNLTYNSQGVLLAYSNNSIIEDVTVSRNEFGLHLWGSHYNNITNNVIDRNGPRIMMTGLSAGVWLRDSMNNVLSQNKITKNWEGIRLYTSDDNVLTDNVIDYNDEGIVLTLTNDNIIYHNNFVNNTLALSWYYSSDIWDDGRMGNFWSDYNGTDLDGDGVGDTDVPWHGDNYPLMFFYWNLADINHDLKVDIFDVVLCAMAYESTSSDPNWNPLCDITEPYGIIDIFDIVMICTSYGEKFM